MNKTLWMRLALWSVPLVCLFNSLSGLLPEGYRLLTDDKRALSANDFVGVNLPKINNNGELRRSQVRKDPVFGYKLADEISAYEQRFDKVRGYLQSLPVSSIGYLGERPRPAGGGVDSTPDEASWLAAYLLTRYSLAPLKFDWRVGHLGKYALLNCRKCSAADALIFYPGWRLRKDFGNGLAVMEFHANDAAGAL